MLLLQNTNFLEISFRTRMHRDTQAGSNSVVVHSLKTAVLGTQIIFILDAEEKNLVRSHCGSIERDYGSTRLCSSPYIQ